MIKKTILLLPFLFSGYCYSQWTTQGLPFNRFGNGNGSNLANSWRSYGFGNFNGFGATPQSRLHLNEFYMLNPWTGTNGNLFRTDGFRGQICQWQFFTGTNATSSTQKFRIYTNVNTSDIQGTQTNDQNITLEASVRDMLFNAGGEIERMRILGLDQDLISFGYGYARAGNVGIGCSHPLSMLQIGGEASIGGENGHTDHPKTEYTDQSFSFA